MLDKAHKRELDQVFKNTLKFMKKYGLLRDYCYNYTKHRNRWRALSLTIRLFGEKHKGDDAIWREYFFGVI